MTGSTTAPRGAQTSLELLWRTPRARRLLIAGMLASVLLFGAAMLLRSSAGLLSRDSDQYWRLATNLAAGRGLSFDGQNPSVMREPLYPLLVAGLIAIFGESVRAVQLAQCLLTLGIVLVVAVIGTELAGPVIGGVAGLLAGAYYPLPVIATEVRTETLYILLAAAMVLCWVRASRERNARWAIACGLCVGLMTLTRAIGIVFVGAVPLALWLQLRDTAGARRLAAVTMAAALVPMVPWVARNWLALGEVRVLSDEGPAALYMGTHPMTLTHWHADTVAIERTDEFRRLLGDDSYLGPEAAPRFRRAALERIRREPLAVVGRAFAKLVLTWTYPPGARPLSARAPTTFALLCLPQLLLVAAMIRGALIAPRWTRMMTLAVFVGVSSAIMVGSPTARYTLPFMPLGLALAAEPVRQVALAAQRALCSRQRRMPPTPAEGEGAAP